MRQSCKRTRLRHQLDTIKYIKYCEGLYICFCEVDAPKTYMQLICYSIE